MAFTVHLEDAAWQDFLSSAYRVLRSGDNLLKRAILVVWPAEIAAHFDREEGWNGPWTPWKASTRSARVMHELRSLIGKQHSKGRLSAKDKARGENRAATVRTSLRNAGQEVRKGGKLLQVTGRLRTQTVLEPILTQTMGGVKVESPTPYSGYLDEGTGVMDARPFMWLGDSAQDRLAQVFADFMGQAIGGTD